MRREDREKYEEKKRIVGESQDILDAKIGVYCSKRLSLIESEEALSHLRDSDPNDAVMEIVYGRHITSDSPVRVLVPNSIAVTALELGIARLKAEIDKTDPQIKALDSLP